MTRVTKTKQIGLLGAGELGRQLQHLLTLRNPETKFVLFDDVPSRAQFPFGAYGEARFDSLEFYVGLGYRHLKKRAEVLRDLKALGRSVPSFIHPSCYVREAKIGDGAVLYPLCNLGEGVVLEDGVILNNSVTLSHHTFVGESSYLSPSVTTSGGVRIGKHSFLGTGVLISDGVTLGEGTRVGIGSVLTRNCPANASVIGNPARQLERGLGI